jgi:kynureninase
VTVGDELARVVLGAAAGQTVVADSTSVNLYKVLHAACGLRPGRDEIVVDTTNFPTDRYLVEAVAQQRGLAVRWLEPGLAEPVTADALAGVLGERTAAVVLSHVDYRSGAILDLRAITAQVHTAGAMVVWDLCHSAGVLPIALDADEVDFAVGCTYKYLNAGPGAPAFLYVAARHMAEARQPVPGWWSAADLFAMADTYTAAADIRRMLSGTPNIMGIVAVREGVRLVEEAGLEAIRTKSVALTGFLLELVDRLDCPVLTPRDPARRGSHVTIQVPDAAEVAERLGAAGVVPDVRRPDLVRLGLSPLSTSFTEVLAGWSALADVVDPSH